MTQEQLNVSIPLKSGLIVIAHNEIKFNEYLSGLNPLEIRSNCNLKDGKDPKGNKGVSIPLKSGLIVIKYLGK